MSRDIPALVCLLVMDGWGVAPPGPGNAIALADTPNFDGLSGEYPYTTLVASGEAVGLPPGQMGNSEVGHLNLGAGRTVFQDLTRINNAIEDGSFFDNAVLREAFDRARRAGSSVHLMGLVSDGGVHSDMGHIKALVRMAADIGCRKVFLHAFMDGRDTPPDSGIGYMQDICDYFRENGNAGVATVSGRFYAMDRDNRWERVKLAYDAIVNGAGPLQPDPLALVRDSYAAGVTDEFILPTVVIDEPSAHVREEDSVIFFNFRPDRARQLTRALTFREFSHFDRGSQPPLPWFVSMTEYDATFDVPVAYPPEKLRHVLAEVISSAGMKQLHIAETEKYAHVTFFFNGGEETVYPGEERVLIPSPTDVATYDEKPEMSARQVTDELCARLDADGFRFVIINLANCDMVGHTGDLGATIAAIEVVDECIGRIAEEVLEKGGVCLVTADHGNAEAMQGSNGEPETAHTSDRVPFIITMQCRLAEDYSLADIAPTVLDLLELPVPSEMTGRCIILDR